MNSYFKNNNNNNGHAAAEEKREEEYSISHYGYEYKETVLQGREKERYENTLVTVRVELNINRERLNIIEKIRVKYGTMSGTFQDYIAEALMNQVEKDLKSPETIAQDFCKNLLQKWHNEPSEHVKRMNEIKPSARHVLINKPGEDPLGW